MLQICFTRKRKARRGGQAKVDYRQVRGGVLEVR